MLAHKIEVEIPYDTVCTLRQACEYIAFDWQPINNEKYAAILDRKPCRNEPEYKTAINEAEKSLNILFEQERIKITGVADPGRPLADADDEYADKYNEQTLKIYADQGYVPWEENTRTLVKKPKNWRFDLDENWIITTEKGANSYRDIKIAFDELKNACGQKTPTKHYTVSLTDDGKLTITDGTITNLIANMRTANKKFQWLKFYFDNPNQTITRTDVVNKFKNTTSKFKYGDRITDHIHSAFANHTAIMRACFPILSDKEVVCRPNFTDLDL